MVKTCRDIFNFISSNIQEIDGLEERALTKLGDVPKWEPSKGECIKINFDAAFDRVHFRSGSRVVTRNAQGQVIASRSMVQENIARCL